MSARAARLAQSLASGERESGASDAFLLEDEARRTLVVQGAVDLFLLAAAGPGAPLRRRHLARVEAGGLLVGLGSGPADEPWQVQAVPGNGTRLAELPPVALQDPALPPLIEGWFEAIAPGAGTPAGELPVAAWWSRPDAAAELAAWHRGVMAGARRRALEAWADEQVRLRERERQQKARFGRTIASLVEVARQGRPGPELAPVRVLAACELVAAASGLRLRLPLGGTAKLAASPNPVEELAASSRVPAQRVALPDRWWMDDYGPLVGFGQDGAAFALLPGPGGYRAVDPTTGEERSVGRAVASGLVRTAYAFGEPLPDHTLGLADVARFCRARNGRDTATIAAMVLLGGLAGLAPPLATRLAISTVIPSGEVPQAVVLGLVVLAAGVAVALFQMVQATAILRIEGRVDLRLQPAVWDRLLKLPASFFRRYPVGDLVARAQMVDGIRRVLTGGVVSSFIGVIMGFFSLGVMLYLQWKLALILAAMALVVAGLGFWIGRYIVAADRQQLMLGGRIQGTALQLIAALPKFRVAGAETVGFGIWAELFRQRQVLINRVGGLNVVSQALMGVFPALALAAIVGFMGLSSGQLLAYFRVPSTWDEIMARELTAVMATADLSAFIAAYVQFSTAVLGLVGMGVQLAVIGPMLDRVRPILETATEFGGAEDDPGPLSGRIECRDVSFSYAPDAPPALDGLTLTVEPGQFVGLCGPSGGGRSTLVRILLGFEAPRSGSVLFDGKDVRTLDKGLLREQLGVVLQSGHLISGTVFDNICAGGHYTREEAWEAARAAGFDQDVRDMPKGMDTPLSADAATISGGQQQRLMIARALLRRPRMLVFDEATSALDNRTQEIVLRSLSALRITRIVIAHRFSALRDADRIFVLRSGRAVEEGTYDELIARDGLFAELARRQTA